MIIIISVIIIIIISSSIFIIIIIIISIIIRDPLPTALTPITMHAPASPRHSASDVRDAGAAVYFIS